MKTKTSRIENGGRTGTHHKAAVNNKLKLVLSKKIITFSFHIDNGVKLMFVSKTVLKGGQLLKL